MSIPLPVMAPLEVHRVPLPPTQELAARWTALERRSACSFFTSWTWIGCWLQWLPARIRPELLVVKDGCEAVALAILVRGRVRRVKGMILSRSLHLHATGIESLDELTIEHNGLLAASGYEAESAQAVARHLLRDDPDWDEVFLDGIDPVFLFDESQLDGARRIDREVAVHWVDLEAVRRSPKGYLGLLGSNTRNQIRSSIRRFQDAGGLRIERAASAQQACDFLEGLKQLQAARWNSRGRRASFQEPEFERFHHELIARSFHQGCIQMLRLDIGDAVMGYFYNFVHGGSILHYQVGIDYERFGGSLKPGLVSHLYSVEQAAAEGLQCYSFLAGDVLYKRRMATDAGRMYWTILQRPRVRFQIECGLRHARQQLRQWRSGRQPSGGEAGA